MTKYFKINLPAVSSSIMADILTILPQELWVICDKECLLWLQWTAHIVILTVLLHTKQIPGSRSPNCHSSTHNPIKDFSLSTALLL